MVHKLKQIFLKSLIAWVVLNMTVFPTVYVVYHKITLWVLYWENPLMVETLGCPNVTEKTFPVSYMHIRSYLEQT